MEQRAAFAGACVLLLAVSGCSVNAKFNTQPRGAALYINGEYVGETPTTFEDDRWLGQRYRVQLFKKGYEPLDFYVDSTMSWALGSLGEAGNAGLQTGFLPLAPLALFKLWAWSPDSEYAITLQPDADANPPADAAPAEDSEPRSAPKGDAQQAPPEPSPDPQAGPQLHEI